MKRKNRFIILALLTILFFATAPLLILYSMGYTVDFESRKIVAKGGIYVKAQPLGATIAIDSISNTTGLLSNYVFVQNLLPKTHTVSIKKEGYHDYQKTLMVKENKVTKLENVILFKKELLFNILEKNIDYFSFAPDNTTALIIKKDSQTDSAKSAALNIEVIDLNTGQKKSISLPLGKKEKSYDVVWNRNFRTVFFNIGDKYHLLDFSSDKLTVNVLKLPNGAKKFDFYPQDKQVIFEKNKNLYLQDSDLPLAKNILAYKIDNQSIFWLESSGFLQRADNGNKTLVQLNKHPFPLKTGRYEIFISGPQIFLKEEGVLFLFNQNSQLLEKIYAPVDNIKPSPNQSKVMYYNNREVFYYKLLPDEIDGEMEDKEQKNVLLNKTSDPIKDCYWINDNYVVCGVSNSISISETDPRGNINTIYFPKTLQLFDGPIADLSDPKIFFNPNDKKIYILNQKNLLVSEKIIP